MTVNPLMLELVVILVLVGRATATWSVLALDLETQQIGGALVTCVAKDEIAASTEALVENSFHAVPCKGGLMAQGWWYLENGPDVATTRGKPLLEQSNVTSESAAQQILNDLANGNVDGRVWEFPNDNNETFSTVSYRIRQYGVVTPSSAAAYTGEDLLPIHNFFGFGSSEAVSKSATVRLYDDREDVLSVQGNVVAEGTIQATADAFENPPPAEGDQCDDLPHRLLQALMAGYAATGGDVRCDGGTFGYLRVMGPNGVLQIDLQVHLLSEQSDSAINGLQKEFDSWRQENPCGGSLSQPFECPSPSFAARASLAMTAWLFPSLLGVLVLSDWFGL